MSETSCPRVRWGVPRRVPATYTPFASFSLRRHLPRTRNSRYFVRVFARDCASTLLRSTEVIFEMSTHLSSAHAAGAREVTAHERRAGGRAFGRGREAAHRSAQISSMDTRMGGRASSSSRSMATGEPPRSHAARLGRPGGLFGSFSLTARRQSGFLHVHASLNVRPSLSHSASGMYCHWPELLSGSGQPGTRHGPSRTICEGRCAQRRVVSAQEKSHHGGARPTDEDTRPARAGRQSAAVRAARALPSRRSHLLACAASVRAEIEASCETLSEMSGDEGDTMTSSQIDKKGNPYSRSGMMQGSHSQICI